MIVGGQVGRHIHPKSIKDLNLKKFKLQIPGLVPVDYDSASHKTCTLRKRDSDDLFYEDFHWLYFKFL